MVVFSWVKQKKNQEEDSAFLTKQVTCPKCKHVLSGREAYDALYICPECGSHITIGALARISMVVDAGTFEPWFEQVEGGNPLEFSGYEEKLSVFRDKTGI